MEYKDILKLENLDEKNEKLKDYYINDVDVLGWMTDNPKQTIKFKNRIEYKENNQYHNLKGPAIEYYEGRKEYYIYGEYLNVDEWTKKAKNILRTAKFKKIEAD